MFSIFNFSLVVYSFFILREVSLTISIHIDRQLIDCQQTSGKSLEEMEEVFGSQQSAIDVEASRAKAEELEAHKTDANQTVRHVER
jgi:hypothetical protein